MYNYISSRWKRWTAPLPLPCVKEKTKNETNKINARQQVLTHIHTYDIHAHNTLALAYDSAVKELQQQVKAAESTAAIAAARLDPLHAEKEELSDSVNALQDRVSELQVCIFLCVWVFDMLLA